MFYFKKAVLIFLTIYYSFAIVVLPMCDFSMMQHLSKMYQNCKETEDRNLTIVDFFTEHLTDFHEFFEGHEEERSEKPHQSQINQIATYYVQAVTVSHLIINVKSYYDDASQKKYGSYLNSYSFIFSGEILHPPIA